VLCVPDVTELDLGATAVVEDDAFGSTFTAGAPATGIDDGAGAGAVDAPEAIGFFAAAAKAAANAGEFFKVFANACKMVAVVGFTLGWVPFTLVTDVVSDDLADVALATVGPIEVGAALSTPPPPPLAPILAFVLTEADEDEDEDEDGSGCEALLCAAFVPELEIDSVIFFAFVASSINAVASTEGARVGFEV
jgi:hypothetical protein